MTCYTCTWYMALANLIYDMFNYIHDTYEKLDDKTHDDWHIIPTWKMHDVHGNEYGDMSNTWNTDMLREHEQQCINIMVNWYGHVHSSEWVCHDVYINHVYHVIWTRDWGNHIMDKTI